MIADIRIMCSRHGADSSVTLSNKQEPVDGTFVWSVSSVDIRFSSLLCQVPTVPGLDSTYSILFTYFGPGQGPQATSLRLNYLK